MRVSDSFSVPISKVMVWAWYVALFKSKPCVFAIARFGRLGCSRDEAFMMDPATSQCAESALVSGALLFLGKCSLFLFGRSAPAPVFANIFHMFHIYKTYE